MPNITKRELVLRITDKLGLRGAEIRQQDVQLVVQSLIDEITGSLAQGESVVLRNFGAFEVKEMKEKGWTCAMTAEMLEIYNEVRD
jgi:DNA-binding protein HU-beta/integration host factor subunit alpha